MQMEISKCAVITGGAQGIGRALAEELLEQHHKVCILDINKTTGEKTRDELLQQYGENTIFFFVCDVTRKQDIKNAVELCVESLGRIDIFINNAGIVNEFNPELSVNVNLTSVIISCGIVVEYMRKDNGGNGGIIVNVSSVAGLLSVPFMPVYCATKSGIIAYTKTLAKSPKTEGQGIVLCCICPGFTDTAIIQNLEDKVLDATLAQKMLEQYGVLKVKTVVDGVIKLLTDQKNGGILTVTSKGTEYLPEKP
ncbi:15-hydroxyprostaglandin dehydrogenase [NAD(+)]-like [Saccostrea echinata]|uniref:15-hydroxyprostaglandin dehydrogenase [NAD(+)]-like n=1 Tax=Saccostrea echinata TaxID=191078 RepID=UPI002A801F75|nr:15-hydroxyprostaglandin dehydrogenase [NAD(+)]-like [Saccostrea echinata]